MPVGLCMHSVAAVRKIPLQRPARSRQPPASRGMSKIVSDGASADHVDACREDSLPLSPASENISAPTPPGERHDTCDSEAEVGLAGKVMAVKGAWSCYEDSGLAWEEAAIAAAVDARP